MDARGENKKVARACDAEALKKCLDEHRGDRHKCRSQIEAFKSSCSFKDLSPHPRPNPNPSLVYEI